MPNHVQEGQEPYQQLAWGSHFDTASERSYSQDSVREAPHGGSGSHLGEGTTYAPAHVVDPLVERSEFFAPLQCTVL